MRARASCLYEGSVCHRRLRPLPHRFEYRHFMAYLDLDELEDVFRGRWLWSVSRPAPARFRREDHLGDPSRPLADAVRDLVGERIGRRPEGPIRLLTNLRHFGFVFNPVSFYYCFAPEGLQLEALVAEVDNTPWGERHLYVVDGRQSEDGRSDATFRVAKEFHVSPFMPMDLEYEWRISRPGARLVVHMTNLLRGERLFEASLRLERREIDGRSLASALARFPFLTARVLGAIYYEALRLWWKGAPYHPHPARDAAPARAEET